MDIKEKFLTLLIAVMAFIILPSCGGDDNDEPSPSYPATEVAGTYVGTLNVTNGIKTYKLENVSFIIRSESSLMAYYDIVREDGKKLLSNIPTTVGYSEDKSGYILGAINEDGTVSKSGRLDYRGTCTVNGEEGYRFTFVGQKVNP